MADKKNALLITLAISISISVGVVAASTGVFNSFFNVPQGETVLINGTILGKDNKNYSILISTADPKANLSVINTAVLDSNNKTFHIQIGPKQVAPAPTPVPTEQCEPDEVWNATLKDCIEIPPEVCTPTQKYNATDNKCYPPTPTPVPTPTPTPVPTTCPPDSFFNSTSGKCEPVIIPNPTPVPTPTPTPTPTPVPTPVPTAWNTTLKVVVTADIESGSAGTSVFNRIKSENPTNVFVLGDLGYDDNLSWFKSTYGTLGNKVNCVLGNHESASEDGTSSLEAESKAYCGNNFYLKKGPSLFLFFNTNGDLTKQATESGKLLQNPTFMTNIKNVFIESHKGCAVPPNSHHPVEVKAFCDAIKTKIPPTVKAFFDSGHNHVMSASADGVYKQSGAGGRSHYECGTSTAFPFCNNSNYGFLVYTIKPDGTVNFAFKDYNGVVKYSK